jgi:hypothetical protein
LEINASQACTQIQRERLAIAVQESSNEAVVGEDTDHGIALLGVPKTRFAALIVAPTTPLIALVGVQRLSLSPWLVSPPTSRNPNYFSLSRIKSPIFE